MEKNNANPKNLHLLTPKGWLDSRTSPALEDQFETIITQGVNQVLVDCSGVDYISSAGLRVFCHAAKKLEKTNGAVILFGLEDYVEELFEISGLDSFMVIAYNLRDALSHAAAITA